MMTQADCLIKAVIACLEARFQEDRGNTERGIPDGFPVPLKMAVDEDREGKEYALFQAAEMEEIVAGYCTYHAGISVELHLDANDRTADEIRMLQAWMEERLKEVDRAGHGKRKFFIYNHQTTLFPNIVFLFINFLLAVKVDRLNKNTLFRRINTVFGHVSNMCRHIIYFLSC